MMKTITDFVEKVEWEGGIAGMHDYGGKQIVDAYDLPLDFVEAWYAFSDAFERVNFLFDTICEEEA